MRLLLDFEMISILENYVHKLCEGTIKTGRKKNTCNFFLVFLFLWICWVICVRWEMTVSACVQLNLLFALFIKPHLHVCVQIKLRNYLEAKSGNKPRRMKGRGSEDE